MAGHGHINNIFSARTGLACYTVLLFLQFLSNLKQFISIFVKAMLYMRENKRTNKTSQGMTINAL